MRLPLLILPAALASVLGADPVPPAASSEPTELSVEASARKLLTAIDTQLAAVTVRWREATARAQDPTRSGPERDHDRDQTLRLEKMLKQLTEQRNTVIRLFPSLAPPRPSPPAPPGSAPP
jgi:hypothetical protein